MHQKNIAAAQVSAALKLTHQQGLVPEVVKIGLEPDEQYPVQGLRYS